MSRIHLSLSFAIKLMAFLVCSRGCSAFAPQSKTCRTLNSVSVVPDADVLNHVAHHTTNMISADDVGLWKQYIGLYRGTLEAIHGGLDPLLRKAGVTQTWGPSIAAFTILIRSLLLPLSFQQSKSTEYMKALKPYQKQIKERFKDNDEAANQAIGRLFEDAKQNPLGGCLLSILQLPILLGLYRGISSLALEGKLEEPFLFIPSLEGPVGPPNYRGLDWLLAGWTKAAEGSPFPFTPALGWETTLAFLVMPLTLVLLQGTTMKIMQGPLDDENSTEEERKQMEQTQQVFKFLPLLIGFFSLQVPAGLTIYWFTANLFTLSQSLAVKAYFNANPPEIELPEYWDTALDESKDFGSMTPEERREAVKTGMRIGPELDELVEEARFHVFLDRNPFHEETEAWKRTDLSTFDPMFDEWVKGDTKQIKLDLEKSISSVNETATTV